MIGRPCLRRRTPELRHARHLAVVAHDLADDAGRLAAGQARQIDRPLGLARADQHAAATRAQRKHVPRRDQIVGPGVARDRHADGVGPLARRDAGGRPVARVDADREGRVPWRAWLSAAIIGSPSWATRSSVIDRQMRPRPSRAMKLIASGVTRSAAMARSPSFSRSSSSTRMTMRPARIASMALLDRDVTARAPSAVSGQRHTSSASRSTSDGPASARRRRSPCRVGATSRSTCLAMRSVSMFTARADRLVAELGDRQRVRDQRDAEDRRAGHVGQRVDRQADAVDGDRALGGDGAADVRGDGDLQIERRAVLAPGDDEPDGVDVAGDQVAAQPDRPGAAAARGGRASPGSSDAERGAASASPGRGRRRTARATRLDDGQADAVDGDAGAQRERREVEPVETVRRAAGRSGSARAIDSTVPMASTMPVNMKPSRDYSIARGR